MSGAQHTPGPWSAEPQQAEGCHPARHFISAKEDGAAPYWVASTDGNAANARLIAAAPEMLATLKVVDEVETARLRHVGLSDNEIAEHSVVKMLRRAIAKAEGR